MKRPQNVSVHLDNLILMIRRFDKYQGVSRNIIDCLQKMSHITKTSGFSEVEAMTRQP